MCSTIGKTQWYLADGSSLGVDIMVEEALACILHAICDGVQWCESILVLQLKLLITVTQLQTGANSYRTFFFYLPTFTSIFSI